MKANIDRLQLQILVVLLSVVPLVTAFFSVRAPGPLSDDTFSMFSPWSIPAMLVVPHPFRWCFVPLLFVLWVWPLTSPSARVGTRYPLAVAIVWIGSMTILLPSLGVVVHEPTAIPTAVLNVLLGPLLLWAMSVAQRENRRILALAMSTVLFVWVFWSAFAWPVLGE